MNEPNARWRIGETTDAELAVLDTQRIRSFSGIPRVALEDLVTLVEAANGATFTQEELAILDNAVDSLRTWGNGISDEEADPLLAKIKALRR